MKRYIKLYYKEDSIDKKTKQVFKLYDMHKQNFSSEKSLIDFISKQTKLSKNVILMILQQSQI